MFSSIKNDFFRSWVPIILLVLLFVSISYITQQYNKPIQNIIGQNNSFAVFIYLVILISAIVVVPLPINTILLIPIAVSTWGPFFAALLSIAGWAIGSMIAFILARRYGRPFVEKLVPLYKIDQFTKNIKKKHMFWSVVALRIAFPTDIISYALGVMTKMKAKEYFFATLIGITPFAVLLSYIGVLPFVYQVIVFIIGMIMMMIAILFIRKID